MTINSLAELDVALFSIEGKMSDKGISNPSPQINYHAGGRCTLWLHFDGTVKDQRCHSFYGTVDKCLKAASNFIADLPSAEDAATHEYMAKIARAVDFAKDNGIDDEYVAPLRGVTCAMTENLLTDRSKS